MRMICHTVYNKDTGQIVWERFTTKGIPEEVHKLTSFGCHYMLNMLPQGIPMTQDVLTTYKQMMDIVTVDESIREEDGSNDEEKDEGVKDVVCQLLNQGMASQHRDKSCMPSH